MEELKRGNTSTSVKSKELKVCVLGCFWSDGFNEGEQECFSFTKKLCHLLLPNSSQKVCYKERNNKKIKSCKYAELSFAQEYLH